jgi:hypothetical protein
MKTALIIVAAFGAGFVVARLAAPAEGPCCRAVGNAIRGKVGDKLGGTAQTLGDALGAYGPLAAITTKLGLA